MEVRFPNRLKFSNCAPGFVATIHVWGLDLPEKEKMKHLRYDAGFEIWASCQEKVYFSFTHFTLDLQSEFLTF